MPEYREKSISEIISETLKQDGNDVVAPTMSLSDAIRHIARNPVSFAKDLILAKDIRSEMNKTNDFLKSKHGKGAADGTDNYYHPLLHCILGQMGNRENSEILGAGKEIYDILRDHYWYGKGDQEIIDGSKKDLQNNENGYIIGELCKHIDCRKLLENNRTQRMIDENIW